jgi:SAM-dependent methyltransferase
MADNALYGDLSRYYDLMCAQINYREQCEQAHRLHKLFGAGGKAYLDLACGTGPHIEHFLGFGYSATGLDLNAPMLTLAAQRCPSATFSQQDMSEFSFPQQFDLITCFLYSMHYCYPTEKFTQAAARAYAALNPGGVFCFDAVDKNTIANDQGASHEHSENDAVFRFQSRWFYSGQGDLLDLHLNIEKNTKGTRQVWQDHHSMVALDIRSMKTILTNIGFEVTVLKRDFSKIEAWDGVEGNVILVCTKATT